ncbi:protein NEDD1-like [Ptychodera flava]|uniref:protein NEDD1-like n=1 Tax=Ptychodera flava TaxID=63121 RepID=UPI00396A3C81
MSELKLVSGGDDIKIWDLSTMNVIKQFNPHSQGLSAVKWSNNNQTLASASIAGDKVVLTSLKRLPNIVSEGLAEGDKQTCLSFISNSRYLISGGKNRIVNIWDMKSRKLKKTFKEHTDSVTCVTVNFNDTYIASGSANGDIILSNVISGQSFSPLRAPKVQAIRGLQYSYFKKSLLGSVSDDGCLNLWDANSHKLLKSFTDTHRSPATSMCFSPVNDMLLASVGLDKRIVCYDAQGKSAVKTITTDCPLTSIDFMTDGATFAVGTSRGHVRVYDLRMGETPKHAFTAHKGSVQCLSFQKPFNKNDSVSSRTSRTTNNTMQNKKISAQTGVDSGNAESDSPESEQENNYQPQEPMGGYNEVFSPIGSIFSPLSDNMTNVPPMTRNPGSSGNAYNASPVYSQQLAQQEGHVPHEPYAYEEPTPIITSVSSPYKPSPARSTQHTAQSPYHNAASIASTRHTVPSPATHELPDRAPVSRKTPIVNDVPPSPPPPSSSTAAGASPRSSSRSTLPTFSGSHMYNGAAGDDPDGRMGVSGGAVGGSAAPQQFQPFQVEFIKSMIEDAVEDARISLHRDIVNLQVEMLRQFQIQMNEMKAEMAKYSVNEALIAEIERLKEENRLLKTKF